MIVLMYGNTMNRTRDQIDENLTPYEVMARSSFEFNPEGLELNGARLTLEEVNTPLVELGAHDNSILMYNKKNTGSYCANCQ